MQQQDALHILSAALNTCAEVGLAWHVATNTAGGLVIILPEATVTDDGRRLLPKGDKSNTIKAPEVLPDLR